MPEEVEQHDPTPDDWFENNADSLRKLVGAFGGDAALSIRDEYGDVAQAIAGIAPTGDLSPEEQKAAALVGRGCSPSNVEELTGIDAAQMALLATRSAFREVVAQHREVWVDEMMGKVQRALSTYPLTDLDDALSLLRGLMSMRKLRLQLEKTRADMLMRARKALPEQPATDPDVSLEFVESDEEFEDVGI